MVFRLKYLAVPVAALLVLAVAATAALLAWPRAAVQALATHFLERPVRIASIQSHAWPFTRGIFWAGAFLPAYCSLRVSGTR